MSFLGDLFRGLARAAGKGAITGAEGASAAMQQQAAVAQERYGGVSMVMPSQLVARTSYSYISTTTVSGMFPVHFPANITTPPESSSVKPAPDPSKPSVRRMFLENDGETTVEVVDKK